MSKFKCYQTSETTAVVVDDGTVALGPAGGGEAVVIISRVVGNPQARALMRLCEAVLNGEMLTAQNELDGLADAAAVYDPS